MPHTDLRRPMLASLADAPLVDPTLVYELKYDGIRAVAEVPATAEPGPGRVRLWSRLGNDKAHEFPDIAEALTAWGRHLAAPLVVDGEIVALGADDRPTGFQQLQRRLEQKKSGRAALILFDVLHDGATDWRRRPLVDRRAHLEALARRIDSPLLRLSEQVRGDGRALYRRAVAEGWEGLIVKAAASRYLSGRRTADWRKLKVVRTQEFVVGGWTEPRGSRAHFGALLLGVHETPRDAATRRSPARTSVRAPTSALVYVGSVGTGFDARELARVMAALTPLSRATCPFAAAPHTDTKAHWVTPSLVVEVRFMEWTEAGHLRHPAYLGLRDDKDARDVVREGEARIVPGANADSREPVAAPSPAPRARARAAATRGPLRRTAQRGGYEPAHADVVDQLRDLEDRDEDGVLLLPGGARLAVTNLRKVFWPGPKLTKGDLFRYYAGVAPLLLPVVADRPLVMKRFPNGIDGQPFYQHRVRADVPAGVRVEPIDVEEGRPQFVGGSLLTLLYMTQLAAISQDPWFSRLPGLDCPDYVALDLDPPDGGAFSQVLDVARWVRDALDSLGVTGYPKTSGATGLHIYVPLPPGTSYEASQLFGQIVATIVSHTHPKHATIERSVAARGTRVYVDYLQNGIGKTLATAYSARASAFAGVSAPLTWQEVDDGIRREDFTITSMPDRLRAVGDLWAGLRASKGIDLDRIARGRS